MSRRDPWTMLSGTIAVSIIMCYLPVSGRYPCCDWVGSIVVGCQCTEGCTGSRCSMVHYCMYNLRSPSYGERTRDLYRNPDGTVSCVPTPKSSPGGPGLNERSPLNSSPAAYCPMDCELLRGSRFWRAIQWVRPERLFCYTWTFHPGACLCVCCTVCACQYRVSSMGGENATGQAKARV